MKKFNLVLSSLTLLGLLSFAGCGETENETIQHTVTFVLNNGQESKQRKVEHGKTLSKPLYKKQYYLNQGWYTDPECEKEFWNFAVDTVTEDITLYAKWEVDFEDWSWRLGRHSSKSTILYAVDHYRNYDPETGKYSTPFDAGFGSGVIIAKEDGYYYALTNNHVVSASNKETDEMISAHSKIVVYDHYMNPYTCELLLKRNDYDLALVKFKTVADSYTQSPSGGMMTEPNFEPQMDIRVAKFAKEDPKVGEWVASYGSPLAQPHVVTMGKIERYARGAIHDNDKGTSNVYGKDVIHHSASILSGNSGGPLFGVEGIDGYDCELVGINYGSKGSNDTFTSSDDFWAIPISLVREFLDIYVENAPVEHAFLAEL